MFDVSKASVRHTCLWAVDLHGWVLHHDSNVARSCNSIQIVDWACLMEGLDGGPVADGQQRDARINARLVQHRLWGAGHLMLVSFRRSLLIRMGEMRP